VEKRECGASSGKNQNSNLAVCTITIGVNFHGSKEVSSEKRKEKGGHVGTIGSKIGERAITES